MRDISKCYKGLKYGEDIIEHADILEHGGTTGIPLFNCGLFYRKHNSEIELNKTSYFKIGKKISSIHFFRRIKS